MPLDREIGINKFNSRVHVIQNKGVILLRFNQSILKPLRAKVKIHRQHESQQ